MAIKRVPFNARPEHPHTTIANAVSFLLDSVPVTYSGAPSVDITWSQEDIEKALNNRKKDFEDYIDEILINKTKEMQSEITTLQEELLSLSRQVYGEQVNERKHKTSASAN